MAEEKVLKPRSFRIDDATAEKFKEVSTKIGGNQQEALAKLIEAYEFQAGKAVLTEKKSDIDQFEKYVTVLTRMYMDSLEDNQNVTETVRTEFDALLRSKDATIQGLQEQLAKSKEGKETAVSRAKAEAEEAARLRGAIDRLNAKVDDLQSMLADKERLNGALTEACNDLKIRNQEMKVSVESADAVRDELDRTKQERDQAIKDKMALIREKEKAQEEYQEMVSRMKQQQEDALDQIKAQSQLAIDRAVMEAERRYQSEIQQLKNERQAEIDKYQQKYFELMEQMKL